ncbi:molybdopterin oxidoreductase [Leucothrix sargassi]|nr:molybdopterin oxidoreductase [Leucothrix sargassi]
MKPIIYRELEATHKYAVGLLIALVLVALAGVFAFSEMSQLGHFVTGMNNHVVWGLPHVIAIFLIVAASGAANIASLSSVFGRAAYTPYARLSLVLAISLLLGGLLLILLDLGRADRLVIALTHFNFHSVFAWNILLYSGFFVIMSAYLWSLMDRRQAAKRSKQTIAYVAFAWRLILTAGTGSIFGVLLAREYYDILMMAPLFIATSYLIGTACFSLVLMLIYKLEKRQLSEEIQRLLMNSLALFLVAVVAFELFRHVMNIFVFDHQSIERFILWEAGFVSAVFWFGLLGLAVLGPLLILNVSLFKPYRLLLMALTGIGSGLSLLYVVIIGGQLKPLVLFPNAVIEQSTLPPITYTASVYEWLLSMACITVVLLVFFTGARVLRLVADHQSENYS